MKKRVLMSFVLLAIVTAGAVFAQQATIDKLTFATSGSGYQAKAADNTIRGQVVIPASFSGKSVLSVGGFKDCPGITGVIFPNSLTSIAMSAFEKCTGITSVTIPASVATIGNYAFQNCNNLTSVTFHGAATLNSTSNNNTFPGDLALKYKDGGPGTYTRSAGGISWTKQVGSNFVICPECGAEIPGAVWAN